jgi:hypothetical protein
VEDRIVFTSEEERLDPSDRAGGLLTVAESDERAHATTRRPSRTNLFPTRLPRVTASFSLGQIVYNLTYVLGVRQPEQFPSWRPEITDHGPKPNGLNTRS